MIAKHALLSAALLLLSPLAPAQATDFTICNKGTVTGYPATAPRNGTGLFTTVHTWKVSGWYEVAPGKCQTVFHDSDGEPIYVGFDNTRGGSDPGGPCKDGYYLFPATLYVTPTGSRGEASSGSRGGSVAKTAAGVVVALIIGKVIADALDSGTEASSAPSPFAAGTLNAMLLGKRIVRRATGAVPWHYEDGSRVNPVYQLEGLTESDLLDAPVQRELTDAEVVSAQADLVRAPSGLSGNRRTEVLNTGRLFNSFADPSGVLHQALTNLGTLDFQHARSLGDLGGLTGYEIPCREEHAFTIGLDRDPAVVAR